VSRAHPLAQFCWNTLRDRSDADQRLVFAALQRRFRIPDTSERQDQAFEALYRCRDELGLDRCPSRQAYDRFRSSQTDPKAWPSATLIRNALGDGSWQRARAIADGEPLPDVTSRRLTSNGQAFSRGELVPLLQRWAAEVEGPLLEMDFVKWCRRLADGRSGANGKPTASGGPTKRIPRSKGPIQKVFGGWGQALESAALVERRYEPQRDGTWISRSPSRAGGTPLDLASAPATKALFFSDHQLLAWLRWAAQELGAPVGQPLLAAPYTGLRRQVLEQARSEGILLNMPAVRTLANRFGSLREAQVRADLITPGQAKVHPRTRYMDRDLVAAVAGARRATKTAISEADYLTWRRGELIRLRVENPEARLPSAYVLKERLGGLKARWPEVLRSVDSQAGASGAATTERTRRRAA